MDEAVIKRIMPHSTEAEQAVIGAMLMNKEAILTASEMITGEDFYPFPNTGGKTEEDNRRWSGFACTGRSD